MCRSYRPVPLKQIVSRADRYAKEDPYYWQVPQILRDMAANGTTFADLNRKG